MVSANNAVTKPQASQGTAQRQQAAHYTQQAKQADTAPKEKALSPLLQTLSISRASLLKSLDEDQNWPELGDVLSQGSSAEYLWQVAPAWQPFYLSEVVRIPDAIFEQYNSTECFTRMGLFPELQRAWITVDNRLYLWNYANGADFQAYEDHPHTITCVKLVRPRQGVFIDAINFVLVLTTPHELSLVGIAAKGTSGELQFYGTRMSVPVTGIDVCAIESTATGRLFFAGKLDTQIYEVLYQSEEGWFSRRCSKINHCGSAFDNFLPSALGTKTTERIVQISIDDSRKVLYSLSSTSTIRAYSFAEANALSLNVTYTYRSALSHAQMINANIALLSTQTSSIVAIKALSILETKQIYLVAVTNTGCRLYMRSSSTGFYGAQSSMSSLQVSHVRYPPTAQPDTTTAPHSEALVSTSQNGQTASSTLTTTSSAHNFAPNLFFSVKKGSGDAVGDTLFASAPDLSRLAQQISKGNSRPLLLESCCWVTIEGYVQDICKINGTGAGPSGIGTEVVLQFTSQPASFAVLTNTGVHIVRRRRTVELLASALRNSPIAKGGIEAEMRKFFENIGRAEGCATCLGVICGSFDGDEVGSQALQQFHIGYGSKLSTQEILDTARKYFIEFGGKAFIDENQNRSFAQDDKTKGPTLDTVRLSGRHDGIALYLARLVASFWKLPFVKTIPGQQGRKIDYISNIPNSIMQQIQARVISLQQFLNTNKNFIDGLNGPDRLLGTNNKNEEIILQAEHRGMHAMLVLVDQIIEGLSFIHVLCDTPEHNMTSIMLALPQAAQQEASKMSFADLITTDRGRELSKELISTIVNRQLAQGGTVETVSETLQKRCGSFCSSDDVVLYKAIEKLKKAKDSKSVAERENILEEALILFEHAASTLSMENLKETVDELTSMQFYRGAIHLVFTVASAVDPYNSAMAYMLEGQPASDARTSKYHTRTTSYKLIFGILDNLEQAFVSQAAQYSKSAQTGPLQSARDSAYQAINDSHDELFHTQLYDWYQSRGLQDRLLEIQSDYIRPYLGRKATQSIPAADLFWHYLARHGFFREAAQVLYDLSNSDFTLSLERRMEYLSQAKNFCGCIPASQLGAHVTSLHQNISEELDVASIQDDLLNELQADQRIAADRRNQYISKLDGKLLPLSELFNSYADPLQYYNICLFIFQSADYRGAYEIRSCWEKLINADHEAAQSAGVAAPYERVAQSIQQLGRRLHSFELVFPLTELVPMLELYSLTKARGSARGWIVDTFLGAGVPHDVLFNAINATYDLPGFSGKQHVIALVADSTFLLRAWLDSSLKPAALRNYVDFDANVARKAILRYRQKLDAVNAPSDLKIELDALQDQLRHSY